MIRKKDLLNKIERLEKEIVDINKLFRSTGIVTDVGWMGGEIYMNVSGINRKIDGLFNYLNLTVERQKEKYVIVKRKKERKL